MKPGFGMRHPGRLFGDDAARDQRGGVDTGGWGRRQHWVPAKRAVDAPGIGIDQQLGCIETVAARRLERPLDAQGVAQAGAGAGQQSVVNVAAAAGQG
jgi:hypothetical protein